jgi:hypothetical protein
MMSMSNWHVGWCMIFAAFVTGGIIGIFFRGEHFLGGYTSFRRRIIRLGHIALAALGMINVLFAISVPNTAPHARAASIGFIVGGLSMPAVCFLTGWKEQFRYLFVVPVVALVMSVAYTLQGGGP